MKTTTEQLAAYRQIEAKIQQALGKAIADALLADGSVCLSNEDGGPITDDEALASHATLSVDVVYFREGARPLTEKGRGEINAEQSAAMEIFKMLEGHGGRVSYYDGDSTAGPLYGRTLDLAPATP